MDTTIRNLDAEAYRRIKAKAALEGRTLGEAVSEAIRRYVEREAAPEGETASLGHPPPGYFADEVAEDAGPRWKMEETGAPAGGHGAATGDRRRDPRSPESRRRGLERLLVEEIWPRVPEEILGEGLSKSEREEILGFGREGV